MKTTIKDNSPFIPPFEDKTVDVAPGIVINIAWHADDYPDLSYLETTEDEYYRSLTDESMRLTKRGKPYSPRYARRLARKYAAQDAERLANYGNEYAYSAMWNMMYYTADLLINGEEIASNSMGGIESDSNKDYIAACEQDAIDQLLARAIPDIKAQIKLLQDALSTFEKSLRDESIKVLRKMLRPGTTVYCKLDHVSRSGMLREISLYVIHKGEFVCINWRASQIIGWHQGNHGGIKVTGCGMDMGFKLVYTLSSYLYPKGFKLAKNQYGRNGNKSGFDSDGGYALKCSWM